MKRSTCLPPPPLPLLQSLKKATYKAAAFYKGLLLPLCASGTCNLREAVIFTSVIRRTSIPVLPSLLCPQFCRYKTEVRREDKEALRDLVKRQHHYALTPEILREIDSSRSRGEQPAPGEAGAAAGGALGGGGGQQMARKVAGVGHGGTAENPRDLAPIIMMDE